MMTSDKQPTEVKKTPGKGECFVFLTSGWKEQMGKKMGDFNKFIGINLAILHWRGLHHWIMKQLGLEGTLGNVWLQLFSWTRI